MATYSIDHGEIQNREMKITHSQEMKIQGTGSGSYKIYGKLTSNGVAKPIALLNVSTFEIGDIGVDDNIYVCDVAGLHCIYADEINGVTKVYAETYAST